MLIFVILKILNFLEFLGFDRMNPALKDIVKEELQKALTIGFIYPISDSKWVSPLAVVPNKVTGKWCILT